MFDPECGVRVVCFEYKPNRGGVAQITIFHSYTLLSVLLRGGVLECFYFLAFRSCAVLTIHIVCCEDCLKLYEIHSLCGLCECEESVIFENFGLFEGELFPCPV